MWAGGSSLGSRVFYGCSLCVTLFHHYGYQRGCYYFKAKFHAKLKDELNYLSNVEINKQTSYSVNLTTDLLTMCRGGITIFV